MPKRGEVKTYGGLYPRDRCNRSDMNLGGRDFRRGVERKSLIGGRDSSRREKTKEHSKKFEIVRGPETKGKAY